MATRSRGLELHALVLGAGVLPVLELEDAELAELGAQPAVAGVEQPELLEVGDDLGEQHLAELGLDGRVEHDLGALLDRQAVPTPRPPAGGSGRAS